MYFYFYVCNVLGTLAVYFFFVLFLVHPLSCTYICNAYFLLLFCLLEDALLDLCVAACCKLIALTRQLTRLPSYDHNLSQNGQDVLILVDYVQQSKYMSSNSDLLRKGCSDFGSQCSSDVNYGGPLNEITRVEMLVNYSTKVERSRHAATAKCK